MKIKCPKCGQEVEVKGIGRPRLDIPVENVYRTVSESGSASAAARELGCSRDYIRQRLASVGLSVRDVVEGREPPLGINGANSPNIARAADAFQKRIKGGAS